LIKRDGSDFKWEFIFDNNLCKNDLELLDITEKARSDFEQAFDISVGEQLRIENMLRGASIGTQPQREKPKLNLNRFLKTNKTYHKTHHNTYNN